MRRFLARLAREERGITAAEFALMLPFLLLFTLGTFEVSRLLMLNQKLQNGSFIMADLVARDRTITEGQLDNIFLAMRDLIQPFDFAGSGTAILTSVGAVADDMPVVNWQRRGAGALPLPSGIGSTVGAPATLPGDLPIRATETVIVAEIVFAYTPIFDILSEPFTLRKVAYYKPRLGTLETVLP